MDNVFVYLINLPPGIDELVTPCLEGYTVYINVALDDAHRLKAYHHALRHIKRDDFECSDVQQIEAETHDADL